MINRNQLFKEYLRNREAMAPEFILRMAFKSTSDEDLAKMFNLKVLRAGTFIN